MVRRIVFTHIPVGVFYLSIKIAKRINLKRLFIMHHAFVVAFLSIYLFLRSTLKVVVVLYNT